MTGSDHRLAGLLTGTDELGSDGEGRLLVGGCDTRALLDEFGSPLYVISEATIRANYRRLRGALDELWPAPVNVLYAIKANNNLAVRAILAQEGAGGDCFGEGELYATFAGGAVADRVVLNGSNKTHRDLVAAAELGVRINVDGEDEIEFLREIAREHEREIGVNLRLRTLPTALADVHSDYPRAGTPIPAGLAAAQWGFSPTRAIELVERIRAIPGLRLDGFHHHAGRLRAGAEFHRGIMRGLLDAIEEIGSATGFMPALLDIGGGLPRERDPESGGLDMNPEPLEACLRAITAELLEGFGRLGADVPELWLEPGRFIAGNAGVLLGTVGEIKRDLDRVWVHVDFSVNDLMRVETAGSAYHVLPASRLGEAASERVNVVGSLCTGAPIARDRPFPAMRRGDVVAVLDAGMYAETTSTQLNGVPRPATVLVDDGRAELIKQRETVLDVFARHRIPPRLLAATRAARPGGAAPGAAKPAAGRT